jgi:hypothetical protein
VTKPGEVGIIADLAIVDKLLEPDG